MRLLVMDPCQVPYTHLAEGIRVCHESCLSDSTAEFAHKGSAPSSLPSGWSSTYWLLHD